MVSILLADGKQNDKGETESNAKYNLLVCCAIEASVVFMYVLLYLLSSYPTAKGSTNRR